MKIFTLPFLNRSNLYFGKRCMANCAVAENFENVPCSIYKLEDKDWDYFEKIMFKNDWQDSRYIMRADDVLQDDLENNDIFVLENEKNKCLGFCVVSKNSNGKNLEYIETIPKQRAKNKKRNIKYIGETLIAFLMKNSKRGENFYIKSSLGDAIPFYQSYDFEYLDDGDYDFIIDDKRKHCAIAKNEQHLGQEIVLIA